MMHVMNIAMDFDDDTIRQKIEKQAYGDILNKLCAQAEKALPQTYGHVDWRILVDAKVRDMLEEHKDEIIDAAAERLVESVRRSKKFREAVEEVGR